MKKNKLLYNPDNDWREPVSDFIENGVVKRIKKPRKINVYAHLTTFLCFIALLVSVVALGYFGVGAGVKQMNIQQCKDYKNYEARFPNSVNQDQINWCKTIGIEIK